MAKSEYTIVPSVLDRLLDYEPELSKDVAKSRSKSISELKQSVRRDLERLLNSKFVRDEIPLDLEEVNKSLAVYGLPDFSRLSSRSSADRKTVTKNVEDTLRLFEPRFANLKVTLEVGDDYTQGLKFRIEASLRVESILEPIVFDTVLQVGTGDFMVNQR